jgi:hypothetical protein
MIEIKAPHGYTQFGDKHAVFLAGSIEMGKAEDWQTRVAAALRDLDILVLNPRREEWDATWEQSISRPEFRVQVEWELNALDYADTVIVYFSPDTKAPITLMELGFHTAANPDKLVVCCPDGFWRKGNVDVICARYGVRQVSTLEDLIAAVVKRVEMR